ncbi:MAG: NUDIX hydrolase [Oscillospiraceae bacterium]|nr:NUDIX hydrolase [Oscillospiraceae bacterium]
MVLERQLTSQKVYAGKLLNIYRDEVSLENGNTSIREVAKHPGGVCVAALEDDGSLWFVRQFRYAVGEEVLELPAGKLEPGEDPDLAVVRELKEETGCTADRIDKLSASFPSPGYTSEVLHRDRARGLHHGEQPVDEDEDLDAFRIPLSEAVKMAMSGEIRDSKTQTLILMVDKLLNTNTEALEK